jgi:transposase-like protein
MAKGQPISQSVKQEIISQVKQGISVVQLAEQNGIIPNTIYNWLSGRGLGVGRRLNNTTDDPEQISLRTKTNDALTIAKLVREKQELTEIIGKFAIQIEKLNSVDSKKKLNFRTG